MLQRQIHGKLGALPNVGLHVDPTTVIANDAVADGKSETCPLAHVLGREERLEDVRQDLWLDSRPFVFDRNANALT
jgi:hypothetical protein